MPQKKIGIRNNAKTGIKREMVFADESEQQLYAQALRRLGSGGGTPKISLSCSDGKNRIGIVRGSMAKRRGNWINPGDVVLIQLGGNDDKFCDIVRKYFPEEKSKLNGKGALSFLRKLEVEAESDDDIGIDYTDKTSTLQEYVLNQRNRELPPEYDSDEDEYENNVVDIEKDEFGNDIVNENNVIDVEKDDSESDEEFEKSSDDKTTEQYESKGGVWENNKKKYTKPEKILKKNPKHKKK